MLRLTLINIFFNLLYTLVLRGDLRFSGFGANDGWSLLPAAATERFVSTKDGHAKLRKAHARKLSDNLNTSARDISCCAARRHAV
jgi:hypothetical protein